jgi:hypothetical protein
MSKVDLPFVKFQPGKNGRRTYVYFRRNGRYWLLPGQPGEPAFLAEY